MWSTVQNFACGRGYLRAADVSSFSTLADGVVVQVIYCTDNGRFCALSDILATSPYNLANSRIMMAIEYARRDFIFLLVLYYLAFI